MREKTLERKLVETVSRMGGYAPKFTSPGMAGFPDRLVLLPKGKMAFVEMKAPGKKPKSMQCFRHFSLRCLGYRVYVIDSEKKIYEALAELSPERIDSEGNIIPRSGDPRVRKVLERLANQQKPRRGKLKGVFRPIRRSQE